MIDWETVPVRDRALRHSVADHVVDAVRSGQLAPGARVHETSLARALDVSLSPVREALFRLADQGVLEHRPRRGFFVKQLDEKETREVYTFRALLEGYAARAAAERLRAAAERPDPAQEHVDATLAEMEQAIEAGRGAALAGERLAVGEWNARFHDRLLRLADHSLLERAWTLLAPAEWLLLPTWTWHEPLSAEEIADWVARHQRLLRLVRSGDGAASEREAREHVREAGEGNVRRRFPSTDLHADARGDAGLTPAGAIRTDHPTDAQGEGDRIEP
jgi:DNA-binding GntR family transcriptional regulator